MLFLLEVIYVKIEQLLVVGARGVWRAQRHWKVPNDSSMISNSHDHLVRHPLG